MKILITGATGFIGKNLKEYYEKKNYKLIITSRGDHILDILEKNKPNVIINSAAELHKPELMYQSNVELVSTFLAWLKDNPSTKMIQMGSSAEYGPISHPGKETDPINPVDVYQGTKGAATVLCQGFARQYNLDIQIARVYSAYGVYERHTRLFPRLYNAFFNQQPMKLFAGEHDFIYIKDFVKGIDTLANSLPAKGEIINFGSGVQTSNLQVLDLWKKITGISNPPIEYSDKMVKAYENDIWLCDTSYAKEKYNFVTEFTLEQGIQDFIKIQHENSITNN